MKKIFLTVVVIILVQCTQVNAATTQYSVSPLLIEHTTEPRDSFEESVKITNNLDRKVRIFPTVHEITLGDDGELKEFVPASMSDRSVSVTSWIEVTRGRIEIEPRDTVKIPVVFKINPNAQPGDYYAFVGFAEGAKYAEAEQKVLGGGAPGVIVRLTIPDTHNEQLRLIHFSSDRFIFNEASRQIELEIANVGDNPVTPSGEVIFYNARGVEIGAAPITNAKNIDPNDTAAIQLTIPENATLGRYKAFLNLDYGTNQRATIYDTTFFTVVPLLWIVITFAILVTVAGMLAWFYHRSRYSLPIDTADDVLMTVRNKVESNAQDHDINLKQ